MADQTLPPGHIGSEIHGSPARGGNLAPSQDADEHHALHAGGVYFTAQNRHDDHDLLVGDGTRSDQCQSETHGTAVGAHLLVLADVLDDLEKARIAAVGRVRAMTDDKGLSLYVDGGRLASLVERVELLESDCERQLRHTMRSHPLGPWVATTIGVGEKQAARLLAAIGDPADRPNVAKLWQYCGHGDPARSHCRKGRPVEHSPLAKMRVHLIAESCIKHRHSPYRVVYDDARAAWADRETSDLHKHNHALRLVGKAMLRDLWIAAREVSRK